MCKMFIVAKRHYAIYTKRLEQLGQGLPLPQQWLFNAVI